MDLVEDGASERLLADHISQLRERLAVLDVVPYGLDPSWTGFRYLASTQHNSGHGTEGPDDEYVAVELAHGRHKDHGPMLLVETGRRQGGGDLRNPHSWGFDHLMDEPGRPTELLVDELPVSAHCWQSGHQQVATFERDGLDVVIRAREWDNLPEIALVRIFDADPYVSGREIMLYRRRR